MILRLASFFGMDWEWQRRIVEKCLQSQTSHFEDKCVKLLKLMWELRIDMVASGPSSTAKETQSSHSCKIQCLFCLIFIFQFNHFWRPLCQLYINVQCFCSLLNRETIQQGFQLFIGKSFHISKALIWSHFWERSWQTLPWWYLRPRRGRWKRGHLPHRKATSRRLQGCRPSWWQQKWKWEGQHQLAKMMSKPEKSKDNLGDLIRIHDPSTVFIEGCEDPPKLIFSTLNSLHAFQLQCWLDKPARLTIRVLWFLFLIVICKIRS